MEGQKFYWDALFVYENLKRWPKKKEIQKHKAVPLMVAWGIWLERNHDIFEGKIWSLLEQPSTN